MDGSKSSGSAPAVKFGCCVSAHHTDAVQKAGFDFAELPMAATLYPERSEAEYADVRQALRGLPLPVEAFNVMLPGDLRIVGPEVDAGRITHYLRNAMPRAAELGGKVVVFGSGRSRMVRDDFDRGLAHRQIADFVREAAEAAAAHGLVIAIEPLNQGETNILNSVPEAVELAREVDHPAARVLADLYHIDVEQEPLDHLLDAQGWIAHVHVADTGRMAPGTGQYDTLGLFRRLKAIGYDGRISIECGWNDFEAEAPAACRFLRETWAAA